MAKRYRSITGATGWTCLLVALALTRTDGQRFSDWSTPENIGPPVNGTTLDAGAFVSKDGLSLYFTSDRPGGFGGNDIWVSQRESETDAWGLPENLGPTINSSGNEQTTTISLDGHRLYFASNRDGGAGGLDLYVSRRHDKDDDFGWQHPVNLGGAINTPATEFGPSLFDDETGVTRLYFSSNRPGGLGASDIYVSTVGHDGSFGPAELVAELSSTANDQRPFIRRDGLEIFMDSSREGSIGSNDLWVSMRASTSAAWPRPVNLTAINSPANDTRPALSFDARTLYFSTDVAGGFGGQDIYVSNRSKIRKER